MTASNASPLTGDELLTFVRSNPHLGKKGLAIECGYHKLNSEGTPVAVIPKFMDALVAAQGLTLNNKRGGAGLGPRKKSYLTTTHNTGILLIGRAYSDELGSEPGDQWEIIIDQDNDRFLLQRLEPGSERARELAEAAGR